MTTTTVDDLIARLRTCRCQAEEQAVYTTAAQAGLLEDLYAELDRLHELARAERRQSMTKEY